MNIFDFVDIESEGLHALLEGQNPWDVTNNIETLVINLQGSLSNEYSIENRVAIHKSAEVHPSVVITGEALIGPGCIIAPHAYIRGGVILMEQVTIGPSCEIKSSLILSGTAIAHLNYVGNSVVGRNVNIEGGAIIANHYNERQNKVITIMVDGQPIETGLEKFGALIGDNSRIGANAVTSPGTILPKNSVVNRLELIDQNPPSKG